MIVGIVRNFINIEGITPEDELVGNNNGHIIIYSDIENLHIPESKPKINSIYEITVNIEVLSNKSIYTPIGKIIVLDGIKKFKILYSENTESKNVSILNLEVPFNTFTELPQGIDDILNVKVNIIDAYFSLLNSKMIYGHFLYLVDVTYENNHTKNKLVLDQNNDKEQNPLSRKQSMSKMLEEISVSEEINEIKTQNSLTDMDEERL